MTVAPVTTTIRGLSTEVHCGTANGFVGRGAVAYDYITTIPAMSLGRQIARLLDEQEAELARVIHTAFDLD